MTITLPTNAGTEDLQQSIKDNFKKGQPRSGFQVYAKALRTPFGSNEDGSKSGMPQVDFLVALSGALVMLASVVALMSLVVAVGGLAFGTGAVGPALAFAAFVGKGAGVAAVAATVLTGAGAILAKSTGQSFFKSKIASEYQLSTGIDLVAGKLFDRLKSQGSELGRVGDFKMKGELNILYTDLAKRADNFSAADKKTYMGVVDSKFQSWGIKAENGAVVDIAGFAKIVKTSEVRGGFNVLADVVCKKMSQGGLSGVDQGSVQSALLGELSTTKIMKGFFKGLDDSDYKNFVTAGAKQGPEFTAWLSSQSSIIRGDQGLFITNQEALNNLMGSEGLENLLLTGDAQQRMVEKLEGRTSHVDGLAAPSLAPGHHR